MILRQLRPGISSIELPCFPCLSFSDWFQVTNPLLANRRSREHPQRHQVYPGGLLASAPLAFQLDARPRAGLDSRRGCVLESLVQKVVHKPLDHRVYPGWGIFFGWAGVGYAIELP